VPDIEGRAPATNATSVVRRMRGDIALDYSRGR
jgi:hypothetical protein